MAITWIAKTDGPPAAGRAGAGAAAREDGPHLGDEESRLERGGRTPVKRRRRRWALPLTLFFVVLIPVTSALYRQARPDWVTFRQGESCFSRAEFGHAAVIFRGLLEKGFRSPLMLEHLAECYVALRDGPDALEVCRALAKASRADPNGLLTRAGLYARLGRFDQAVMLYRRVLQTRPGDRAARFHLARALGGSGRFAEAAEEYRRVLGD